LTAWSRPLIYRCVQIPKRATTIDYSVCRRSGVKFSGGQIFPVAAFPWRSFVAMGSWAPLTNFVVIKRVKKSMVSGLSADYLVRMYIVQCTSLVALMIASLLIYFNNILPDCTSLSNEPCDLTSLCYW